MHTEGERETELVLGTKQLLGLLFVSFVLLGIFFAMGYVLGRNSVPPETVRRTADADRPTDRPTDRPSAAVGEVAPAAAQPGASAEVATARSAGQSSPSAASEPATATASGAVDSGRSAAIATNEPKSGELYVQLRAVARPDAEMLAEVLTKRGFRSLVTPSSKEGLFRVLVGPARTEADLGKLRTDLEEIGFKGIPRKIP
ncbi:MAG TPA: SPOR domain-containing protein [Bryobacteraceae bacterium]|nr:SPOR domain-containing protein [Bryobacteraceae bacterium]